MISLRLSISTVFMLVMGLFLLLTGCMQPIPYEPDQVAAYHAQAGNISLEFATDRGRQTAFYIPLINASEQPPARINILYRV